MTSKTSFCNGTLFGKTLRRFWPLWVAYLLIWILVLPLGLHNEITYPVDAAENAVLMQEYVYRVTHYGSLILTFGMAPLAAMAVFSGMYEEKRAGVFASLPIRREASFGSLALAGLVPQLAVPLLCTGLAALVAASNACFLWTPILTFLGITALYTCCFYGFAVFCAQLTGQLLIVPAVYVVLEFTAPLAELLIRWLLTLFVYGYESGDVVYGAYLSPFIAIIRHSGFYTVWAGEKIVGWSFSGWVAALICAASGVLLTAAALLLYRKRRTETAGDTVAVRPLKKVFSFALGIGCALVASVLLAEFFFRYENLMHRRVLCVAVGFLLGGFIGYFGAEMLMRKTFRVFGACWRGGLILFAGLALLLTVMQFDVLGIERRLPAAEKIQSVELHTAEGETTLQEPGNIEKVLALNKYVLEHRTKDEYLGEFLRVRYNCGDDAVTRYYQRLPDYGDGEAGAELARLLEAVYNSEEAIERRFPHDVEKRDFHYSQVQYWKEESTYFKDENRSVGFYPEQAYEWYTTCVLPDVEDGLLGRVYFDETHAPKTYNAECWLDLTREKLPQGTAVTENAYRSVIVVPNVQSTRTNEWLKAHGVELYLRLER